MMARMTRYALPLALLGLLLLTASCRHRAEADNTAPRYSHEEALPVSSLPHAEFSTVTPPARTRGRKR